MPGTVIRATLSGSFRKDFIGLTRAYDELITCGCQVLSPHRLDFSSTESNFVKDKAETHLSEEAIEHHHLLAITQSDFVWLHSPGGYTGKSASFELGFAIAHNVPVFASEQPEEVVFVPFIRVVPSVYQAVSSLAPK